MAIEFFLSYLECRACFQLEFVEWHHICRRYRTFLLLRFYKADFEHTGFDWLQVVDVGWHVFASPWLFTIWLLSTIFSLKFYLCVMHDCEEIRKHFSNIIGSTSIQSNSFKKFHRFMKQLEDCIYVELREEHIKWRWMLSTNNWMQKAAWIEITLLNTSDFI